MRYPSIVIMIPYFGPWPDWINLFVESCARNPTIHWIIFTDNAPPENIAPNVRYFISSLDDYCAEISRKLNVRFRPQSAYKLCDARPMLGYVHGELIRDYDFYGYGDLDLVYGNIREALPNSLLKNSDVVSCHSFLLSGHLALFRNTFRMRNSFRFIPKWKRQLSAPQHVALDESHYSKIFRKSGKRPRLYRRLLSPLFPSRRSAFIEQFTTPMMPYPWINSSSRQPARWFWKDGCVTNEQDGDRSFIYLHFMNWRHARYAAKNAQDAGSWSTLQSVLHGEWQKAVQNGFSISRDGICPLNSDTCANAP